MEIIRLGFCEVCIEFPCPDCDADTEIIECDYRVLVKQ